MKVLEMINEIEHLKRLRDDLDERSRADDITAGDSDLMGNASVAITYYIEELYRKEVKV